jgi:glycosyltransferase involved in cell wall biosynthesis
MKNTDQISSLLIVVQRYGIDVNGGAELYARWLAESLHPTFRVDILTTCAGDYITWENTYPAGWDTVNGIPVYRCTVDGKRDIDSFDALTAQLLSEAHTIEQEKHWLKAQGPVSKDLLRYVEDHHVDYDALIFVTYLYYPCVEGIKIQPDKSLLIPTAHDEPVAHFQIFHEMFNHAAGIMYLTSPEEAFVRKTYNVGSTPQILLGTGIDIPSSHLTAIDIQKKYELKTPVLLYIGRVEAGKGCTELIDYFQAYCDDHSFSGTLLFAGKSHLGEVNLPQIRFLGFVPDEEIGPLLDMADIVMVPSPFESLSILLLQALFTGTPVLANAQSEVTKTHCKLSNGGLFYSSQNEFCSALDLLLNRADIRNAMGQNGRAYVESSYRWELVVQRLSQFLPTILK